MAEKTDGVERGPRYAALIRSMVKWSENNPGADAVRLGRMMLDEVHALETELADTKKDYVGMCAVVREREAQVIMLRTMLISAQCPDPKCQDGSLISTGPEPQNDACEWCMGRDLLLNADKSAEWKPTHVHSDGGTYRFLHKCRIKMIDGVWHDGVVYETMSGEICATHLTRWEQRFEAIK